MELKTIPYDFTVCKLKQDSDIDVTKSFYFVGKTDEEISLVCKSDKKTGRLSWEDDGKWHEWWTCQEWPM